MLDITRILCPIDFSDFSRHALDHAVAMARWYEARVTALHVYTNWPDVGILLPPGAPALPPGAADETAREELFRQTRGFVERHQVGDVQIEVLLQEAPNIHREILAQASALKADLVVMGSHGRSGFERLLLGSTTERVLRKAACPVMVVPPRVGEAPRSGGVRIRRILCPVDFSDSSIAALTYAMSLAEEADAGLTVLHVMEFYPELRELPTSGDFNLAQVRASAEAACLRRLRDLIPESVRTYCTVETVVSEGKVSREIERLALEQESDLIVMGVQGRNVVDVTLFGSNTHHVIRAAPCPVLTVRGH